uniref:Uncharacterized protein n=1 Tax=Arundo donax TaxID=35708 RepID=A0A0A9DFI2_ARUDO
MYRGLTSASRCVGRRGVTRPPPYSTLLAGEASWDAKRGVLCAVLDPRGSSRSWLRRRNESRAGCCLPGSGEHDGVGGRRRYSDE